MPDEPEFDFEKLSNDYIAACVYGEIDTVIKCRMAGLFDDDYQFIVVGLDLAARYDSLGVFQYLLTQCCLPHDKIDLGLTKQLAEYYSPNIHTYLTGIKLYNP